MQKETMQGAAEVLVRNHRRRIWKRIVSALACVVVFCTTYALILPAITLEKTPGCGKTEHTHSEACYTRTISDVQKNPMCSAESLELHKHTANCYNSKKELVCGYADFLIHKHDDMCYKTDGKLRCGLTEIQEHKHDENCYTVPKTEKVHTHTDKCYTMKRGKLICTMQEESAHIHTEECYTEKKSLVCATEENEEHKHNEECYKTTLELTCSLSEEPHQHTDSCYAQEKVLTCELSTEPTESAAPELVCGKQEIIFHKHDFDCFDKKGNLICGKIQVLKHQHTDACFENAEKPTDEEVPVCGLEEHVHSDLCQAPVTLKAEEGSVQLTATVPVGGVPDGTRLVLRTYDSQSGEYKERGEKVSASLTDSDQALMNVYPFDYRFENENGELVEPNENVVLTLDFTEPFAAGEASVLTALDEKADGGPTFSSESESDEVSWKLYDLGGGQPAWISDAETTLDDNSAVTALSFTASAGEGNCVLGSLHSDAVLTGGRNMGYISGLRMNEITDGTAPFDGNDNPGNDSSPGNKIVRSFDTIEYELATDFGARNPTATEETATVHLEMILEEDITTAVFDMGKMGWLEKNYIIQCLDAQGEVVLTRRPDGNYYDNQDKKVDLNAYVSDSRQATDSYKTNITKQVLTGHYELKADGTTNNVLAGDKTFSAGVRLYNADNGKQIAPSFRFWLDENEENYSKEEEKPENKVDNTLTAEAVTVSAGAKFNLQLKKNVDMTYKSWFDFSTGEAPDTETIRRLNALAYLEANRGKANPADYVDAEGNSLPDDEKEKYANIRYGRMSAYGISLQLYNELSDGGMKGFSLPAGDISFNLNFISKALSNGTVIDEENFTPILWDYKENINAYHYTGSYADRGQVVIEENENGKADRRVLWNYEERSPYAKGAGPSNYRFYHNGCYYGGDWGIDNVGYPSTVTGDGSGKVYRVTVRDFDFDFDQWVFPSQDAGNGGEISLYTSKAYCFSAGFFQVLSVMPRYLKDPVIDLELESQVKDLTLTTRDGQSHDFDGTEDEGDRKDNIFRDKLDLYAPGGLTKGSSFNAWKDKNGHEPENVSEAYLGTEYWTTSYDCSTFAGDKIWLMSYGMMMAKTDYRTRAMNLLQLFDSRALRIDSDREIRVFQNLSPIDVGGTAEFLYAADPDYPNGYDTNSEGILEYMNGVREEDLKYYTSLGALQEDGYTCVGVLMEMRGCNIGGGKYQYLRIPLCVNGDDEDLVNKTVATVNAVRVWTDENDLKNDAGDGYVSWKDGVWNVETGKNTLKGYTPPKGFDEETGSYSPELANRPSGSPNYYVKTEYSEGKQVSGTHGGGTLSGNSLLILGYKAGISILVEGGKESYDMDKGETTVNYTLTNIETKLADQDSTGQTESPRTTLTIPVQVDSSGENGEDVHLNMGVYTIKGYAVNADGSAGSEKTFAISTDPSKPTSVGCYFENKFYTFTIYAEEQSNAKAKEVVFHLADVPVGAMLPDISFSAGLENGLKNNATIDTTASISGAGDCRAYSTAAGNTSTATVSVIKLSGSFLTKGVDKIRTELDEQINYTVTYVNNSSAASPWLYFYDLLPYAGDGRGSKYSGTLTLDSFEFGWKDDKKESILQPEEAATELYYSTTSPETLAPLLDGFKGGGTGDKPDSAAMEQILANYFEKFESGESLSKENVTCIFVKVQKLPANNTVEMKFGIKPTGNSAKDRYGNTANSWWGEEDRSPLTSKLVQTVVVAREISGFVWYDKNFDGVRDEGEPLVKGVEAALFKWDDTKNAYILCPENVLGTEVPNIITTGSDGAYKFEKLAQGRYIVAFKGDALQKFTGATDYQVHSKNDETTNDGKLVSGSLAKGIPSEYKYYICYESGKAEINLLPPAEIKNQNSRQVVAHQDLGVIIATYELPKTGGPGTLLYTFSGIALMASALMYNTRRRRKEGR